MNFSALCKDYGIDVAGSDHHHVTEGWLGVHCPFCAGSRNYHLGYNIRTRSFSCWRCGYHPLDETLEKLTGETFASLWGRYGGERNAPVPLRRRKKRAPTGKDKELFLPNGFTVPLLRHHRQYLAKRRFDPDVLSLEWGIKSTPVSTKIKVGEKEYHLGNRIFIPVMWNHKLVSFQARYQGRQPANRKIPKYTNCPGELEVVPTRQLIYKHHDALSPYGICVEGPTDVWRLGRHAFAPLGMGYSNAQVALISKLYRRVMVLFDPEANAQKNARELCSSLQMLGVEAWVHKLPDDRDPGELSTGEARSLVKYLIEKERS